MNSAVGYQKHSTEGPERQDRSPFHVLCLSGGGVRGIHSARILEIMEQRLGTPVARHFDLLCGTSIGGILALGLALQLPASVLLKHLTEKRQEIFALPLSRRLSSWLRAKHAVQPLRDALVEIFGDATLGDLTRAVVIPAVDASAGSAVMFKTPHHPSLKIDYKRRLVDVALATAAAPTYFPISRAPDARLYVDGGLVANHPGLCGLHEAEVFFRQQTANVHILSIGTASVGRNVRSRGGTAWKVLGSMPGLRNSMAAAALDLGVLRWGPLLFDLTISAQEAFVHNLLTHRCRDRYTMLDSQIDTERSRDIERLNATSQAAVETLLAAAAKTGQEFVGDPKFDEIAAHEPGPVKFFYGTHSGSPEVTHEHI